MTETNEGYILVVDDDRDVLDCLSELLKEYDYPAITCQKAHDVLTMLRENPVSVVLTDIMMPEVSGLELLQRIREFDSDTPVILMTAYADVRTAIDAIDKGAFHFITKPFKKESVIRAIEKALHYCRLAEQEKNYRLMLEDTVLRKTQELAETALTASKLSIEIVQRLSAVAEFRDTYTGAHISRIGLYSRRIAEALDMHKEFIDSISIASSLHDIGKIGIPDNILLKPGRLSFDEFNLMKTHSAMGAKILKNSSHPILHMGCSIALNHHERWEGGGYPQGLRGKDIPIEGRIVKLADEYDALRSLRVYKPPLSHEETCTIITEGDGRTSPDHFDPEVLRAFVGGAPEFDNIFQKHQDFPVSAA